LSFYIYKVTDTRHENYWQLIWMLAKTDFKIRYQNSFLGYFWAILKPLFMFSVLYFVFSSIFNPRNIGGQHYSLSLLVSLILFSFFSEGTTAGMQSLQMKSDLVLKIYVPRWCIIMASTIHSAMVFFTNFLVIAFFFIWYQFLPPWNAMSLFILFSLLLYAFILSVSLLFAPLFIKFRDMGMIWEVVLNAMFYTVPIVYPLQILPEWTQRILLVNPVAFIIHFVKELMFNNHYVDVWQFVLFFVTNILFSVFCIWGYRLLIPKVAESM